MGKSTSLKPYGELIWGMMKTGILGFGGGPSVIPLIRHEAVRSYQWIDDDEFGEILALANTLPGPIATKMAGYLGYRLKGIMGAIVSVVAHILPSALAMIVLMSGVYFFSQSAVVQGMIQAIVPVVVVMLALMAYEFAEKAVKGLGKYVGFILFVIAFVLLQWVDIHDAFVIFIFLLYGTIHFKLLDKWKRKRQQKGDV